MKVIPFKPPTASNLQPLQDKVTTLETTVSNLSTANATAGSASLDPIYEFPPAPSPVIIAPDGTLSAAQGTRLVNQGKTHTVARTTGVMPPAYQATLTAPLALLAGGNLTLRFAIQPTIAGSISVQLDAATPITATGNGTAWTSNDAKLVARSDGGWTWFEVDIPQRNDAGTTIKVTMPIGLVQLPCLYYPPVQTTIAPPTLVGMKLNDSRSSRSINQYSEIRVATVALLQAVLNPINLMTAIVAETGLRYEFRPAPYVGGVPGRIEIAAGVWTPMNCVADPGWLRSQDFATRYERTLKGATINRVQLDACQRDDRTKTAAIDVTDFVTGCSVSGYWGINGKFSDITVVDRTLKLFLGVDVATGRVVIAVQDLAIANPKFCWIRNVRINGLPADLTDGFEIARSAFPKN